MEKRKHILVFEGYPVFSGAQRVSLNICKVLKKQDLEITLLLADDPSGILTEKFRPFVDSIHIINTNKQLLRYGNSKKWFNPVNFFLSFFKGLMPFYFSCYKLFKRIDADVFYFCDPRGAAYILLPSLFFRGKKVMYLQSKNKLKAFVANLLMLKFTHQVMCPSIDVLESLPPSDKKVVVNYGIDLDQYNPTSFESPSAEVDQVLLESGFEVNVKLLYAGLIKPQKGIHHLIYAMSDLKEQLDFEKLPVLFVLGSPITEAEVNFQNTLQEFCRERGLESKIFWMGRKDNVLGWMKYVDYFVFPTIDKEKCDFQGFEETIESSEGSPVVLIESSLCGCFALASRVTGVSDTILDYRNGLTYDPNDSGALTSGLLKLINERPKYIDFPNRPIFSIAAFENSIKRIFEI